MKKVWILLLFVTITILGCDTNKTLPDVIEYGVLRLAYPYVNEACISWIQIDVTGNDTSISIRINQGYFKEYTLLTGRYSITGVQKFFCSGYESVFPPIDEMIYLSTAGLTWTP